MPSRISVACVVLALSVFSFGQSSETTPNTSICFSPLQGWCDPAYNGGAGYPGWNDNEPRPNMDPIRTHTINIGPANVSLLDMHQLLPSSQQNHTLAFTTLQMWFSGPKDSTFTVDGTPFDRAGNASHLMNGAIDCPSPGSTSDCSVNDNNSQARWDKAVTDIRARGFDGVIAITQGGQNTCLRNAVTHPNGTTGFGQGSDFGGNCANGSNQYRPAAATLRILHSIQNLNSGAFAGMKMAWMEDVAAWKNDSQCGNGGWGNDSADQRLFQVKCVQTKLRADFQWAHDNIWSQAQSYTSNSRPIVLIFDDVASGVFTDSNNNDLCAGGACTLLDGTTCANKSLCWTAIWNQHRAWMQTASPSGLGTNAMLIFRNGEGFTHVQSDGAFLWVAFNDAGEDGNRAAITTATQAQYLGHNDGCAPLASEPPNTASESTALECFYHRARLTMTSGSELFGHFAMGGAYKGFDPRYASWYFPNNPVLSQLCGLTWYNTWQAPDRIDPVTNAKFLDSTHQLPAMVANTWDDYEEGSEIQTGIDNCFTITATQAPAPQELTLKWDIPSSSPDADPNNPLAIAEYDIFQDTSTTTFAKVAVVDRAGAHFTDGTNNLDPTIFTNRQLDVSHLISNPPNWFFVEAKGIPSVTNHLSSNVDFWPSWGSVTINGAEQSKNVGGGFYCAWYTENGDCADWEYDPGTTVYDSGTVSITVNGFTKSVTFDSSSTPASIATALVNAFNADPASPVTAKLDDVSEVYFTTKLAGRNTNYSLSTTYTYDSGDFSGTSFWGSASGGTMTGGIG